MSRKRRFKDPVKKTINLERTVWAKLELAAIITSRSQNELITIAVDEFLTKTVPDDLLEKLKEIREEYEDCKF